MTRINLQMEANLGRMVTLSEIFWVLQKSHRLTFEQINLR